MRSISAMEMAAIDRNAQGMGIDPIVLMENAGRQVAEEISRSRKAGSAVVLCGPGNNGGDGFVSARHLANMGWRVTVVEAREPSTAEARRNRDICRRIPSMEFRAVADSCQAREPGFRELLAKQDVVVDALLGTGSRGLAREPIASLIKACEAAHGLRVAVDIPSGLDVDSGTHEGEVFRADLTVTFHCAKTGHTLAPELVGELVVVDIGIPREAETLAGPGDLLFVKDRRRPDSHKGDNGVLLVVGGSKEYQGAPAICGIAALRTGIDLAYLAVPEAIRDLAGGYSPSLICRGYRGDRLTTDSVGAIVDLASRCDAVCIGPGLGQDEDTLKASVELVKSLGNKPMVVDADALKAFAGRAGELGKSVVITPHAGEFRILTGRDLPQMTAERRETVLEQSRQTRCTWVVKGPCDVVAWGADWKENRTGTACMTVGGTGDCLTGVIGALLARHNDPFRAAVAGTYITGRAGEMASARKGCHILATDVAEEIPSVFKEAD